MVTRRELNLAIFERRADAVLWQPRLETWVSHHRNSGTLPERYRHLDNLGIYDALRCSVRYAASAGLQHHDDPADVETSELRENGHLYSTVRIPEGELTTVHREVWEGGKLTNRRIAGFPVKTEKDLRVLIALTERRNYRADQAAFKAASDKVGHRAEPTVFTSSSGFTDLIKWHCGLPGTYYLLADHPSTVEAYLEACDRRDDRLFDAALQLPARIYNLGDHATDEFTPPPILRKYLLPRWQRISHRVHAAGRFVHSHWDGHSRTILPYLLESGLDSVEALTPEPMGNITLEEIKKAVRDKLVVLDLLPAIHFLPSYTVKECVDFARKAIELFAPRLILGVSDEISQVGQIEKIEAVSELVDEVCGLAE